jgi:hypothetical protein
LMEACWPSGGSSFTTIRCCFPIEKNRYYSKAAWAGRPQAEQWTHSAYLKLDRPYRVHNVDTYPSWLERFEGPHPAAALGMWQDALAGRLGIGCRPTEDIERLLRSPTYRAGRIALKAIAMFASSPPGHLAWRALRSARRRTLVLRSVLRSGSHGSLRRRAGQCVS